MWTKKRLARALSAVALVVAPVAWACGPFFPERMLINRSTSLLAAPRAKFATEVAALKVKAPALAASWAQAENEHAYARQTVEVDLSELKHALDGKPEADGIQKKYREVRDLLWNLTIEPANGGGGRKLPPLTPPTGTPPEFALYLEGAIAQARNQHDVARQSWENVLKLPAAERRHKSTWAAYMLARSYHGADPDQAVRWYQETRTLALQGFRDALGLGAASLGYEAQVELDREHFGRAAHLYLQASALDEPNGPSSLRYLCWRLMRAPEPTRAAALKDRNVRQVIAIHLAASDTSGFTKGSSEARLMAQLLEQTRDEKDVPGADRLAWVTYQMGDLKTAEEWLQRAPESSPVRAWIRSKLLARQGKLDDAARELTTAVAAFPLDQSKAPVDLFEESSGLEPAQRLRAELAVLKLARSQYVDALELMMRAGYWRDAAHIAERVLTLTELREQVDKRWPEPAAAASATAAAASASGSTAAAPPPPPAPAASDDSEGPSVGGLNPAEMLRYLLARRLARAGRWKDARPYFPPLLRPQADAYMAAQSIANDAARPATERADALWVMARMERKIGLELIGTEVGPDWRVDEGQFNEDEAVGKPVEREKLALVSRGERQRVRASAPAFAGRFHYRYVAAQRAMEASKLLPDGDARVAETLCTAFDWLKNRDPKAARPYLREARRRKATCP